MQTLTRLPQRIAVVGTSGSGKTTLARSISQTLSIPHIEFDALYWGPNWTPIDKGLFRERVSEALSVDRWVTCGNYGSIKEITFARADTVAWLDYPFPLVLSRLIRRTTRRLMANETLWEHNHEKLRKVLSRDSIILWAFQTHWKHRRRYLDIAKDPEYSHLAIIQLRSPRETDQFMQGLSRLAEESVQSLPA
jgi:adenylate kinase family enzyme